MNSLSFSTTKHLIDAAFIGSKTSNNHLLSNMLISKQIQFTKNRIAPSICSCILITIIISIVGSISIIAVASTQIASSRNILIKRSNNNPNFKCGQVPIYKNLFNSSIEPELIHSSSNANSNPKVGENSNKTPGSSGDFRILYGLDAKSGEWPWIAKIDLCQPNLDCETCTGSLLNDRWLITAGHCARLEEKQINYTATIGQYDLLQIDKSAVRRNIDKVIRHPDYQDLTNDLSLMRLEKPIEFNSFIQPVCMPDQTRDLYNYAKSLTCLNIGYGLIENMMQSVRLQKILIRPRPSQDCNSDKLDQVQLRTGTICIGPPEGKIGGSCHGDSGGPDVCYDKVEDQWLLIGTVSYGPNDCDREQGSKWLTVSVDVTNYRNWIIETIRTDGIGKH